MPLRLPGTALAAILARFAARPARIYVPVTVALAALSLVAPSTAADTAISTKVALAGAHLLAAAIIIAVVGRRPSRRP